MDYPTHRFPEHHPDSESPEDHLKIRVRFSSPGALPDDAELRKAAKRQRHKKRELNRAYRPFNRRQKRDSDRLADHLIREILREEA